MTRSKRNSPTYESAFARTSWPTTTTTCIISHISKCYTKNLLGICLLHVHHCQEEALATTTATVAKTSLNMNSSFFKLSAAFISVRLKCQKYWANFPGVDFLGTALKCRKRKKNSSSLAYTSSIKRKIMHFRAETAEKCTRKV